jgi:hypothetical protein
MIRRIPPTSILLGSLAFLFFSMGLFYIPGLNQWFYNTVYIALIFPAVRFLLDHTWVALPFNGFFLAIIGIAICIGYCVFKMWKTRSTWSELKKPLFILISGLVLFFCHFYWLWGYHYVGPNLATHLQLTLKPPSEKRLLEEVNNTLEQLIYLRGVLNVSPDNSVSETLTIDGRDSGIIISGKEVFKELNLKVYGRSAVKPLPPDGWLYRWSTSGFYNPYTGECNIESDMHPLQVHFVMAHEWTHAQGITDEGDANFLAYLICIQSIDPYIQYSGHLAYWRYIIRELQKRLPDQYPQVMTAVPVGIKKDLLEIRESLDKYPDFLPALRDAIYDTYLKTHGVSEGLASYNKIVTLVVSYKRARKI